MSQSIVYKIILICSFLILYPHKTDNSIYFLEQKWDDGVIKASVILHTEKTNVLNEVKDYGNGTCVPYARARSGIQIFGSACTILDNLPEKYSTSSEPRIGSILLTNEGRCGHLSVVEKIFDDSIRISEQNYRGLYIVNERILQKGDTKIITYIYEP